MPEVVVHRGVIWVYQMTAKGDWWRYIKAFPEAVDKKGEPDPNHAAVLKYIREKHG